MSKLLLRLIASLVGFVLGFFISYLLGSAVAWDWNPKNWEIVGRYGCVMFGLFFGIGLGVGGWQAVPFVLRDLKS